MTLSTQLTLRYLPTIETKNNGQISFLDTLMTRKNGSVTIGVYRKSAHTDRYLDFNSHHELKHKISTASTLLNRALNLPSTAEGVRKELTHVSNALKSNGYPSAIISNILKKKSTSEVIPSPEELVGMFFKWSDPPGPHYGFAVLPYIKGVTEPLTRILNNNGIRATTRTVKTLQQEFASPKSRNPPDRQTNVVYKIPCADCTWNYIGEMGRCLYTRKKEHIRNTKVFIASHVWLEGHTIDFENARVIDRSDSRVRKTLESWHTAITIQADNNSKQLPRQYSILL